MNKLKLFLLSSLLCLAIASFAQNGSALTPFQEGEYLMKIMMMEMTLDDEKKSQVRDAIYTAANEEQKIFELVGNRKDAATKAEISKIQATRDEQLRGALTEEEFEYYEEIVENLYAKIYDIKQKK
ncbi:MAG: hypothetical protein HKN22_08700 [Bacteroidia bacterium]|nr:hypothetical protein [Bacteroidia bacterium]